MPVTPLEPRRPWKGKRIVLGVTGGIAAYKAIQVARDLTRLGGEVDVVLTKSAEKFVASLTFEGVTGRPVLTDLFSAKGAALHVRLGRDADVVAVAPATADFLARAAQGRADDLICTTLLATSAPVVICPAMNDKMYAHPQVQDNLDHLQNRLGYQIAGPVTGALAVSEGVGRGRLIEPWQIEEAVGRGLAVDDAFMGKSVLVTAGPTQEPIDPVRYIGNHSSGRMGYAIAQAAWRRGAKVTLVSGPSALDKPFGVDTVAVETAQDMHVAVAERIGDSDLNIFSAAVADFRPTDSRDVKLKRNESADRILVDLTENPDVARDTRANRKKGSVNVGFALETEHLVNNALAKLESKDFDLVVANDANEEGAGFSVRTNRVTFVEKDAQSERLPLMSKDQVAEEILDRARSLVIESQ